MPCFCKLVDHLMWLLIKGLQNQPTSKWKFTIELMKWNYSACCLGYVFLISVRHLRNSIWNTSFSGVQSFVITRYMQGTCTLNKIRSNKIQGTISFALKRSKMSDLAVPWSAARPSLSLPLRSLSGSPSRCWPPPLTTMTPPTPPRRTRPATAGRTQSPRTLTRAARCCPASPRWQPPTPRRLLCIRLIIWVHWSPLIRSTFCPRKIDHTSRLTL